MKRAKFIIQNDLVIHNGDETGTTAEVYLYDVIGKDFWGEGIDAKAFIDDLNTLGEIDRLTVRINSPGGSVFDGNAMYNALKRFPAEIVAAVDGLAASAASLIAMAGDKIEMAENAMLMIHEPYSWADGTAAEHRRVADALEKVSEGLISAYVGKSGQTAEQIQTWMTAETWMTATEAVEAGLADETVGEMAMAACVPPGVYKKTPERWETGKPNAVEITQNGSTVTLPVVRAGAHARRRAECYLLEP